MALITRISRLFRADLHEVLDRIEEPDVLLRQAVREMGEELAHDEQRIKVLDREHAEMIARQAGIEQSLAEIEEGLDVCFTAGKDELARSLIRRRLEAQRYLEILGSKRSALQETLAGLRDRVGNNRTRLESMRQKAELLTEAGTPDQAGESRLSPDFFSVREEDVEVVFLREQQKRRRT
jgi:phage shock protein A